MQHRRSTFAKEERGRLQTKRLEPLDNKNKKSERRRPTGRTVQHIPPCPEFIRSHQYTIVTCTVFCGSMNSNAFVTNLTCRKCTNKNPGSRPQRSKIINCKQATRSFHQTCKTSKKLHNSELQLATISRKHLALAARTFCHRPPLLSRSKQAAVSTRNHLQKIKC